MPRGRTKTEDALAVLATNGTAARKLTRLEEVEARLGQPIDPDRIRKLKRAGSPDYLGKGTVIMALNSAVGALGWSHETSGVEVVYQHEGTKDLVNQRTGEVKKVVAWTVVARATCRLTVGPPERPVATHTDIGVCDSQGNASLGDSLTLALKGAATDALKRAARVLGPRMGLALQFDEEERMLLGLVGTSDDETAAEEAAGEVDAKAEAQAKPKSQRVVPEAPAEKPVAEKPASERLPAPSPPATVASQPPAAAGPGHSFDDDTLAKNSLHICKACSGCLEGKDLTRECPGQALLGVQSDMIKLGKIDYFGGRWQTLEAKAPAPEAAAKPPVSAPEAAPKPPTPEQTQQAKADAEAARAKNGLASHADQAAELEQAYKGALDLEPMPADLRALIDSRNAGSPLHPKVVKLVNQFASACYGEAFDPAKAAIGPLVRQAWLDAGRTEKDVYRAHCAKLCADLRYKAAKLKGGK